MSTQFLWFIRLVLVAPGSLTALARSNDATIMHPSQSL